MVLRIVDRFWRRIRGTAPQTGRRNVRLNDFIDGIQVLVCVVVFVWFCLQRP